MTKSRQNKKNTPRQSKYFCLLLYQEWDNLPLLIDHIKSISNNYAYIQHTKDVNTDNTPKKEHYHVVVEMGAKRTINGLYEILKGDCLQFTSNLIQFCETLSGSLRYLTHVDYPEKYQYEYNNIITNDKQWLKENYERQLSEETAMVIITDYIKKSNGLITMMDLYNLSIEKKFYNTYSRKNANISRLVNEHNNQCVKKFDIENQVDRKVIQAMGEFKRNESIMTKLANTFDRVQVLGENGEVIEIMNTGLGKK